MTEWAVKPRLSQWVNLWTFSSRTREERKLEKVERKKNKARLLTRTHQN